MKKYIGTDISGMTLEKTEVQLIQEGYTNIELLHMDALEIEKLKNNKISIIFMSSVAQYLKNYETFKKFLEIACSVVDDGIIFIGDVPDLQKKLDFIKEVEAANGKMDEAALWYSRQFMRSMEEEIPDIQSVEISDKQGWTIANELTKYRYDVLYKVKKHEK